MLKIQYMPIFINDKGKEIWFKRGEERPPLHVGTPRTQKEKLEERRAGIIRATARAMRLGLPEEEIEKIIELNATSVEMDPNELRDLASQYIEQEETNSNSIEKE